jgi:hypothetical protein
MKGDPPNAEDEPKGPAAEEKPPGGEDVIGRGTVVVVKYVGQADQNGWRNMGL